MAYCSFCKMEYPGNSSTCMFCGRRDTTTTGDEKNSYVRYEDDITEWKSSSYNSYDSSYSASSSTGGSSRKKDGIGTTIIGIIVGAILFAGIGGETGLLIYLGFCGIYLIYVLRDVLKLAVWIGAAVFGYKIGGWIGAIVMFCIASYIISLMEG